MSLNGDGCLLASGDKSGKYCIWDIRSRQCLKVEILIFKIGFKSLIYKIQDFTNILFSFIRSIWKKLIDWLCFVFLISNWNLESWLVKIILLWKEFAIFPILESDLIQTLSCNIFQALITSRLLKTLKLMPIEMMVCYIERIKEHVFFSPLENVYYFSVGRVLRVWSQISNLCSFRTKIIYSILFDV